MKHRCYAPTELEHLVKHELERTGEDASGLKVQIFRHKRGWTAKLSAPIAHRSQTHLDRIGRKMKRASLLLAPSHKLIGG
jgi:hypothetical protein